MGFSSVAAASFILFACISQMRASVLPAVDAGLRGKTDKFTLRITEQQANFEEQVAIDEDNDIEYFSVPAHNDVNAADFLFDFKMNITLARLKEHGVCYLTPLPSELPKPNLLKQGLRKMTALPPNHQIKTVSHKWKIDAKIDKTTLRREVRDFCGQYPVYHLYDYTPDSIAMETERVRERAKRQISFPAYDLCDTKQPRCPPTQWILRWIFFCCHSLFHSIYLHQSDGSISEHYTCSIKRAWCMLSHTIAVRTAQAKSLKTRITKDDSPSPNHQITTVSHKWKIDAKIDKTTLRREVRDFCGQYPIYRLYDYTPDSIAVETDRLRERAKRQTFRDEFDLCGQLPPPCSFDQWILRCKFTYSLCVYYVTCRPNIQQKQHNCETTVNHLNGKLVCCEARCPTDP
ncbi:hypothetical protein OS493_014556 [Desmophyllum pertusum]|uniref:BRICHOS domain-containing protein n=1 Tax=Desmophyllum pertusum TaxID=174260 RepID=A0A9W9YPR1_9CNID|nr:hypothetical protein OS493_014556 [Desmophyllum pertusum]